MRGLLALLLASTVALPAYSCSGYRTPAGEIVSTIPAGADSADYTPTEVPHWPLEDFEPAGPWSWLTLFLYAWPLMLFAAESRKPRIAQSWTASLISVLLPLVSAWWIYSVVVAGRIKYGAVLSLASLACLWMIALRDAFTLRRARATRAVGA